LIVILALYDPFALFR
jgi:hypothetical protein